MIIILGGGVPDNYIFTFYMVESQMIIFVIGDPW